MGIGNRNRALEFFTSCSRASSVFIAFSHKYGEGCGMLSIGNLILNSLDYILIVDRNYNIVFNTRYDARVNLQEDKYELSDILNKNFYDIYPCLNEENSSFAVCMNTGNVVVKKRQEYYDYKGNRYITNNVTVPIRREGTIVGAVELAKDVENYLNIDSNIQDQEFNELVEKLEREAGLISFDTILTCSEEMEKNIDKAKFLSRLPNPTLICGETGTGKEVFAQAMINYSQAPRNKVVIQNCAAVPENLMESILFGTEKGAYTGAETHKGLFEEADGGILFLDELNSIPFHVQAKLLRVLQDGTFRSLGSDKEKKVNTKVIGAMNIDPIEAMEQNIIRKDLFYRFSSGLITLLPLRERKDDIELFLQYYIKYYSRMYDKKISGISADLRKLLVDYSWEGNVRELKNTIETMVSIAESGEVLGIHRLPVYIQKRAAVPANAEELRSSANSLLEAVSSLSDLKADETIPYAAILEEVERKLIHTALEKTRGNKTKASEILGLPRQTLKYRIEKLDL